ncbi:hypothetical protein M0R45_016515 [Rubus argutus]|uniref:Uncharacterized protein n=1 Tax=Rubus argutus TaxID=59490 RepID=A0AAW1XTS7_RUBAR
MQFLTSHAAAKLGPAIIESVPDLLSRDCPRTRAGADVAKHLPIPIRRGCCHRAQPSPTRRYLHLPSPLPSSCTQSFLRRNSKDPFMVGLKK